MGIDAARRHRRGRSAQRWRGSPHGIPDAVVLRVPGELFEQPLVVGAARHQTTSTSTSFNIGTYSSSSNEKVRTVLRPTAYTPFSQLE